MSILEIGVQMEEAIAQMKNALIDGLVTDGAHHKQFYLEKALLELIGTEEFNKIKAQARWEEGTP